MSAAEQQGLLPISQANLHRLFRYENGRLFNRVWRAQSQPAGKEAGGVRSNGYRYVSIGNKSYLQHRLIWVMFNGDNAPPRIDHIDQNPLNNRIENLRPATQSLNAFNGRIRKNNTSGHTGVQRSRNRWHAFIFVNYRNISLGYFATKDEAVAARLDGEVRYYGERARKEAA